MSEDDITEAEQRTMLARAFDAHGYDHDPHTFTEDTDHDDGRLRWWVGDVEVIDDNEDEGLYEGEFGRLYASVVGGREYNNLTVAWYFVGEGSDEGIRCDPGNVEVL